MDDLIQRQTWDVIVVGTGMGGSTLGYRLAKAGKRVLFCEKGRSNLAGNRSNRGRFAETFFASPAAPSPEHADILASAGRWTDCIDDRSTVPARVFIPFIGAGSGGSSALFGMAMERFHPRDFAPRANYPDAEGADLPAAWPIDYDDLRPYYQTAESLFRIRGALDPLRSSHLDPLLEPRPMTEAANELYGFLQHKRMHPYQLPLACERVPGCEGCQGFLCARDCKNDAAAVCLRPAVHQHEATLLDRCRVIKLDAGQQEVTGVVCERDGERFTLRGELIVVAAGALGTPCILLRSRSPRWPDGLANHSGMVGRNLMRHCIDLFAVFLKSRDGLGSGLKELAFNDYYFNGTRKLGTVQSFGALPPAPVLVATMHDELRHRTNPGIAYGFELAKPFLRWFLGWHFSRSLLLAAILEDLPYPSNQVHPAENGVDVVLNYRLSLHDRSRIEAMRRKVKALLKPYRVILIKQAENNERIAHVCGTCRFGVDPQTSVLDPNNKAHGVDNLYVVDSSFFPSSAGSNPGLTIAANALRVADQILGAEAMCSATVQSK